MPVLASESTLQTVILALRHQILWVRFLSRTILLPMRMDAEAERSLGVTRPSTRLQRERLRWTGHMLRSEDTVLFHSDVLFG